MLAVHCINDEATIYSSYWAGLLVAEARTAGHDARELTGAMVTAYGLLSSMEGFVPEFVILAGHGSARIFTGAGYQTVLEACVNDGMMSGSQCMFISCLTGLQLVPSIVSKDGLVACGFTREYVWMIDGSMNPATDMYAASFTRIWLLSVGGLLRGGSWQDFYRTWKQISDEEIARWSSSVDPVAPSVVLCLRQNRDSLVVNGAGTLEEPVPGVAVDVGLLPLIIVGGVIAATKMKI